MSAWPRIVAFLCVKLAAWLASLRTDTVFGWRQLWKNRVTSAAAILSLGLALGACTAAFCLVDALLLRPLPVAEPSRLFPLSYRAIERSGEALSSGNRGMDPVATRRPRMQVRGYPSAPEQDRDDPRFWANLPLEVRVLEVWRLSEEQWRQRGEFPDEPGTLSICRAPSSTVRSDS